MSAPFRIRVQNAAIRSIYALPQPIRRAMAGPPVRIDGQELTLDAQLMARLKNLTGSEVFADPIDKSRKRYEELGPIIGGRSTEPIATRAVSIPAQHGDIPSAPRVPQHGGHRRAIRRSRSRGRRSTATRPRISDGKP
jgi:hypothetical protein